MALKKDWLIRALEWLAKDKKNITIQCEKNKKRPCRACYGYSKK